MGGVWSVWAEFGQCGRSLVSVGGVFTAGVRGMKGELELDCKTVIK